MTKIFFNLPIDINRKTSENFFNELQHEMQREIIHDLHKTEFLIISLFLFDSDKNRSYQNKNGVFIDQNTLFSSIKKPL